MLLLLWGSVEKRERNGLRRVKVFEKNGVEGMKERVIDLV